MSKEKVILVDENDTQVGLMPKLEAHQKGLLHRAFSVFIFNSNHQLLLQKRAVSKYHSGGLWTNTCCSHPREGEETINAANRRLIEEMGIKTNLRKVFDFIYKAELDNELIENEFDHVFYVTELRLNNNLSVTSFNFTKRNNSINFRNYCWI